MSNDGWIEWNGGDCPVDSDNTVVEVKYRSGIVIQDDDWVDQDFWDHLPNQPYVDIIAYRIIQTGASRDE